MSSIERSWFTFFLVFHQVWAQTEVRRRTKKFFWRKCMQPTKKKSSGGLEVSKGQENRRENAAKQHNWRHKVHQPTEPLRWLALLHVASNMLIWLTYLLLIGLDCSLSYHEWGTTTIPTVIQQDVWPHTVVSASSLPFQCIACYCSTELGGLHKPINRKFMTMHILACVICLVCAIVIL